ncbi:uncharacterized protein isoform X2 [Danio rerio]|uniref:Uncharacterized protein isoform X2 n=1 Tax=Danio rerio TaxID=7955 RepID=A0AC58IH79_DANRE
MPDKNPQQHMELRYLIFASVLLNVLLIIAVIGLGKSYIQTRTKKSLDNRQSNTAAQYSVDSQYAEVNLPTPPTENRHCDETRLYSLLQPMRPV